MERIQQSDEQLIQKFEFDQSGFVDFDQVARDLLQQQSQYASRYIDGSMEGYPNLGDGLRFEGETDDYYDIKIHREDIQIFVNRVREYKKSMGNPFA